MGLCHDSQVVESLFEILLLFIQTVKTVMRHLIVLVELDCACEMLFCLFLFTCSVKGVGEMCEDIDRLCSSAFHHRILQEFLEEWNTFLEVPHFVILESNAKREIIIVIIFF